MKFSRSGFNFMASVDLFRGSLFVLLIYLSSLPYASFHLRDSDRVIILFPEEGGPELGKLFRGVVCLELGSL